MPSGGALLSPNTENGSFRGGSLPRGGRRPSACIWESDMNFAAFRTLASTSCASGLFLALALTIGTARAQDKTYVMKITTPTLNASPDTYARNYAAAIEQESRGRIKAEVYPASQLGSIPRQIEGTQFGAIQCAVIPPEFFVGVDERFEVLAAPGLVSSVVHAQHLASDPQVSKLILALGADKGLRGVGLLLGEPNEIIAKTAIRHLDDLKGKKIRIFASDFQSTIFKRLGATPVAMSLGDVLPGVQQGTIDGAISGITVLSKMHFWDAAKYVTKINQPGIFLVIEVSKKWYEALPKDLQEIIDRDGAAASITVNPRAAALYENAQKAWTAGGGELIELPADDRAAMMKTLATVGDDIAKSKPALYESYKVATEA